MSIGGMESVKPSIAAPFHSALSEPVPRATEVWPVTRESETPSEARIPPRSSSNVETNSAFCGSPMPTFTGMDLLVPPYEQVSVPEAISLPAVNTPFSLTVPILPVTVQWNRASLAAARVPRWYASASTSTLCPGLTEMALRSFPPLCSAIDCTLPVMQTSIEPETAPFEPVMAARPAV